MHNNHQFFSRPAVEAGGRRWDWAVLPLMLALLILVAYGASQMARPYRLGDALPLSLDPAYLPYYLLRTTLRMFAALAASLIFSCVFAVLAAKYRAAERVLVPLLDILQSIPILGFLSITVTGFIALFPGNLFGVECAAIFAIFTSQAWNMAFSLYQSLRTVPGELHEAARVFQLSGWQRFWRLELPLALPRVLASARVRLHHAGRSTRARPRPPNTLGSRVWDAAIAAAVLFAAWRLAVFIHTEVGWAEVGHVFVLAVCTLIRVLVLIALAA